VAGEELGQWLKRVGGCVVSGIGQTFGVGADICDGPGVGVRCDSLVIAARSDCDGNEGKKGEGTKWRG
jgi:hypothetical protein